MKIKYKHTNIIAHDWEKLTMFYEKVLGCTRVLPERHLSGKWLTKGTGVKNAKFSGIHLRLPGHGKNGPTLEIYQYSKNKEKLIPVANQEGFSHIAFEIEDIPTHLKEIRKYGGGTIGEITSHKIEDVGYLTFVYATDPEGNIIELQNWK